MMEQGIEGVIADKGTGGVGDSAGETGVTDGLRHGGYRNRSKIGGGAFGDYKFAHRLVACIVLNPGIPDIDGDPLWRDSCTAGGDAHAQDHMGIKFGGSSQNSLGGGAENCGQHALAKGKAADLIGQLGNGHPGGIFFIPAEGIKAGDEQAFFHDSILQKKSQQADIGHGRGGVGGVQKGVHIVDIVFDLFGIALGGDDGFATQKLNS